MAIKPEDGRELLVDIVSSIEGVSWHLFDQPVEATLTESLLTPGQTSLKVHSYFHNLPI